MPQLVCPVRNCQRPLATSTTSKQGGERSLTCDQGHTFDRARSGYINLLQPQDKRAQEPGDSSTVTQARRRCLERGLGNELLAALLRELERADVSGPRSALLDVGAGEGFFAGSIAARLGLGGWGVDISRAGIDAAARRYPSLDWVIANADRRLPFADGGFDAVTSITGPKHGDELRRLLAGTGVLLLAVPAPDDQRELRTAVLGEAHAEGRSARMRELFAPWFRLEREQEIRSRHLLDAAGLDDLFATGYRGARHSERERLADLGPLEVTVAYTLLTFKPVK